MNINIDIKKKKKKLDKKLLSFVCLSFINSSINSIIVPFFPLKIYQKGINLGIIGLIFAIAPLGSALYEITLKKIIPQNEKFKTYIITIIFKVLTMILLGMLDFFDNKNFVILFSIIGQLLHGLG